MKQCPKCSRVYADDQLNFCLDDGEWLVAPNIPDEPATAILSGDPPSEVRTVHQVRVTDPSTSGSLDAGQPKDDSRGFAKLIIAGSALLALVLIGLGAYRYTVGKHTPTQISFEKAKLTRLTTTGKATNAAISPDGKYVVHVQDDGGQQSLWIRQAATQSNVQIQPPSSVIYDSIAFSPDGNFVYYSVSGQQFPQRVLFQVPTLGGTPKRILEGLDGDAVSFSPDGRQFAFVRRVEGKEIDVMIADTDGGNQRKLVGVSNPPESLGNPSWSPDGKKIAYTVLNYDSNDATAYEAQVSDGSTKQITDQRWLRIYAMAWMSDGNSLLILAPVEQQFVMQVWQVMYPSGESRQLTNDLDNYAWMSLTSDSKTIALVKTSTQANVWIAPFGGDIANLAHPITSGVGKADHVAWTPEGGRIVYTSNAGGSDDIWIVNSDGSNQSQLTANARINRFPVVSPDGRYIVFLSDRGGTPHLWRMNIDGGELRQLANGPMGEQAPQFSPDGRWIFYNTAQSRIRTAWKIASDGSGAPIQLKGVFTSYPTASPDGKLVAYFYKDDEKAPFRIAVAPLDGGDPLKMFDLPATFELPLRWTPDGRSVAYIDTQNGVSNLVAQPLDGGQPKQLTNFRSERIFWFDFSRDGRQIAFSRGTQNSDVELISGF